MLLFFSLTLFVSATLLFLVQPMIGKMILPKLGGTPAVWNTCMVFFQAMLLVGYGYTHTLSAWQNRRRQLLVHAALLFVPLALMVLPFSLGDWEPSTEETLVIGGTELHVPGLTVYYLLWRLLGLVGLPFFVVATSAPLLQKWFAHTGHPAGKDPYFLYGASNLGSMLGLLLYPLWIEWMWDVQGQAILWTVGYVVLIALVLGCAVLTWRSSDPLPIAEDAPAAPPPAPAVEATAVTAYRRRGARLPQLEPVVAPRIEPAAPADPDAITALRRLRWVLLAAVPSSLMLGVTTYMTTDIAAVPFFWVVPLSLYLLTFILVFARWPVVWTETPHTLVLYLQPCFLLFLALRMIVPSMAIPTWGEFALHVLAFFTTALMCHGELAKDRPSARHLTEFYLWMSVGGVLGGLFNALIAPLALPYGIVEYPLAMVVACLLRPYMAQDVSQARPPAAPRKLVDWLALPVDAFLYVLGMTTYSDLNRRPARALGLAAFVRGIWPRSSPLEIALDLVVPVVFGFLAYGLVIAGENETIHLGGIVFRRSYLMAGIVVLALAMAMRPVRFGLSVGGLFLAVALYDRSLEHLVFEERGFFGLVRVRESDEGVRVRRTLIHGGINHGQQLIEPASWRRQPITYFHPSNGIGEVFHKLTWGNPPDPDQDKIPYRHWMEHYREIKYEFYPADARLPAALLGLAATPSGPLPWTSLVALQGQPPYAVVGLGTGTLAAHAQPFQHVDFFEIDPIIKRLSVPASGSADDLVFYYVDDALRRGANLSILMGDGRLKIRDAPQKYYHAITLDAFSSDAIPVHLLTKEAVEEYLAHLVDGGVLIFNTTNRYVRIQPVLAGVARELHLECLSCPDWTDERYREKYGADWVVLRRKDQRLPGGTYRNGGPALARRLDPVERWQPVEPLPGKAWTDGYSNLLGVMRW